MCARSLCPHSKSPNQRKGRQEDKNETEPGTNYSRYRFLRRAREPGAGGAGEWVHDVRCGGGGGGHMARKEHPFPGGDSPRTRLAVFFWRDRKYLPDAGQKSGGERFGGGTQK